MRFDWSTVRFALFVSIVIGGAAPPALAAPVTWEFTGNITSVASFATGHFTVGDLVTYRLTMDSALAEVPSDVDNPDVGQYLVVGQPLEQFNFEATIGGFQYHYSGSFVGVNVDRVSPRIVVDTSLTGVAVDGPGLPLGGPGPLWNANVLDFGVSFLGATPWATDDLGQLLPSSPFAANLTLGFCPFCDGEGPGIPGVSATFTTARQIPEPATLSLFLLGAAGAALTTRLRRRVTAK